ncbi:MAG: hypothetical protein BIFFINMI_01676 [Phycisphaerae bacterium]|nr:hypothetical protein [Phycisphaerae bacterium]
MTRKTVLRIAAVLAVMLPAAAFAQTSYPYYTTVTGDDVALRAGPGAYWYPVGKVVRGQKVHVVGSRFGWVEIDPPVTDPVQFSLIRIQDVQVSGNDGVVRCDGKAPVWAGSPLVARHNCIQVLLDDGARVQILKQWSDGDQKFYMIMPPPGATIFLAAASLAEPGADQTPINVRPTVVTPPPAHPTETRIGDGNNTGGPTSVAPSAGNGPVAAGQSPTTQPGEELSEARQNYLKQKATVETYHKMLRDEMAKPLENRDYDGLLKKFRDLRTKALGESDVWTVNYAGKCISYLQDRVDARNRILNAAPANTQDMKTIVQQAEQIAKTSSQGSTTSDLPQYEGVLQKSAAFHDSVSLPDVYKLVGANQSTVCYIRPSAAGADWSQYLNRPVRVWGQKTYYGERELRFYYVSAERIESTRPAGVSEHPLTNPTPAPTPVNLTPGTTHPTPVDQPPPPPMPSDSDFGPRFEDLPGGVIDVPGPAGSTPPAATPKASPESGGAIELLPPVTTQPGN